MSYTFDSYRGPGVRRALAAVPDAELLGAMGTAVYECSPETCLVCRLVDPDRGVWGDAPGKFATKYGVSREDANALYMAAAEFTGEVEELIANRLDDIIFGKSVGQAA